MAVEIPDVEVLSSILRLAKYSNENFFNIKNTVAPLTSLQNKDIVFTRHFE